jgi:molecular chaperone DnaK
MVKEAAEHEAEDKLQRARVERRNKVDNLCYTLERATRENKDRLEAGDASRLEGLVKEGRDAVEKQEDALLATIEERLEAEVQRVASVVAQSSGAPAAQSDASTKRPTAANRDRKDIVDAEFEETQKGHL